MRVGRGTAGVVVGNYERWLVQVSEDVGSRKGFTGTGHPKQRLVPVTCLKRTGKLIDRPLLIAARFELRGEFERHQDKESEVQELQEFRSSWTLSKPG